jgi:hypothetical protein
MITSGTPGISPLPLGATTSNSEPALSLSEKGRWKQKHNAQKQTVLKMEFKNFRNAFIQLPCQIVKTGRRIAYRLRSWNPWLGVFFRGFWVLRYSPG